ncbi:cytochrome P450 94C1-like [Brachypodium distachyon]|uniref:cytochrome P450 94C1-like n=1 Tax=Brachypodium distachyon TaxID=15368 RepID=UPI000D0D9F5E|nr:cytochrome P450 94C1-like [Brachypodium distachyon]|eukprot:XP_024310437.1 cytochrome P450 94C1-like [Brachypodium distachyon]
MSDAAAAFDTATRLSAVRGMAVSPLLWKMKRLLSVGGEGELKKAIKVVHELANAMIRERRSLGVDNKSPDLLSRFMSAGSGTNTNAMDHDNEDKFLRDIVVSFLIAGRDTISSGLTTLFMLLSKHRAAGAAMRAEATKASDANAMTYEELKALHYTHAAVHESLRLFPPVQFDSKFCAAADVLPDGTYVDAGSRVMYHPYAMGRMPSIWGDDCEEFRPERWLTGAGATFEPVSFFKYPVFQAGLRVCLGKELAIMEMKAVCVAVLRAFDVKVVGERAVRECAPVFAPGLSASIQGGLPVKLAVERECE